MAPDAWDVVIVACQRCGPVPVRTDQAEVHADLAERVVLYAAPCPACHELLSGGDRDVIEVLRQRGARRRRLDPPAGPAPTTG